MNPQALIPANQFDDVAPFFFILMLVSLVVLPTVTFSIARKWGNSQPQMAAGALAGAVVVSIVGILVVGTLILAVLGWLPPPNRWSVPN